MTMTQSFDDFNSAKATALYEDVNNGGNFMALKMHKDSLKIKKPPLSPLTPYRKPVIIHTYSPKVIQAEAHNFMQLVQKLTGWDSADKKRKRKSKNKISEGGDSEILTSSSLNNGISSVSVKATSAEMCLNEDRSLSNIQQLPSFRHNCFEEKVNNVSSCGPAYFMPDNLYASSQSALSSMDLSQAQIFNHVPNILSSSHYFHFPCKQQLQGLLQPCNYAADGIYMNPSQENPCYFENLPASVHPAIGEFNFSECLPPVFSKGFEF